MPLTDDDLRGSAYRLSGAMLRMLAADGLNVDIVGVPDREDADPFAISIQLDAEQYMSMNPDRLTEEFNEIRDAALATKRESDPAGVVDATMIDLQAWWTGDAANAFFDQMYRIKTCIETQYEFTLLAAQAVGMMYAVNAQFRASCQDLMERTADTCEAVITTKGTSPGFQWSSVATSLAKAAIDAIKDLDPGKVKDWTVDQILAGAAHALKPEPIAGAEAIPVVEGYTSARDRLFLAYEDNLDQIREWLGTRRDELADSTDTIPHPLPSSTDVDSPDFRYEAFSMVGEPVAIAAEVERERQRYVDEKARPDGVIARRLADGG
ncbi:MAG TPA: hypothetical protein VHH15_02355 [Actinophytocola sp.]|nr:hypothetical protein [Actinophytocola sp.]